MKGCRRLESGDWKRKTGDSSFSMMNMQALARSPTWRNSRFGLPLPQSEITTEFTLLRKGSGGQAETRDA